MEQIILKAEKREPGRRMAKKIRDTGKVPGIFYGYQQENVNITFDAKTLVKFLHSEHTLVTLDIDGQQSQALVRSFDKDPVTEQITHVDVLAVRMDRPVDVNVPIVFTGTPAGVKTKGGIIQHDMIEFHIKCLPAHIPPHLEVNIDSLDLGQAIHVRDLHYDNITLLNPASESVCTVVIPKALEAVLAETQTETAEPELIGAKEKEEAKGDEGKKDASGKSDKKEASAKTDKKEVSAKSDKK
jgi:large subunit ribosomal protein L25